MINTRRLDLDLDLGLDPSTAASNTSTAARHFDSGLDLASHLTTTVT
jgi:hypothetical protein